ncbi:MAG TPA: hydroxymethylbilane synthase, partial [Ktedonobacterales bacterium]|nr:hydroxymethylbilane synthase [Ktedonobacterales bacterium]
RSTVSAQPPMEAARIGTRGSALALWQAHLIRALLVRAWPALTVEIEVMKTQGDVTLDSPLPQIGGKGVFTAELEAALRSGAIDLAVHSLKDLPTEDSPGLIIGAIPERGDPRDALVSRGSHTLDALPTGAAVGTSSLRRAAQLLVLRPDLRLLDIRGNVDTRIRKALDEDGPYDAIVLALAGLERLGRAEEASQWLPLEVMLPAPGQGALAVQCRDEQASRELLAPLSHRATTLAVTAERAFLAALGGGCAVPVAAHATYSQRRLSLRGRVTSPDGSRQVDVSLSGSASLKGALALGQKLAEMALAQHADELLEEAP